MIIQMGTDSKVIMSDMRGERSMISKQVADLREYADERKGELANLINRAADTIEALLTERTGECCAGCKWEYKWAKECEKCSRGYTDNYKGKK